jgi:hypothetical protein
MVAPTVVLIAVLLFQYALAGLIYHDARRANIDRPQDYALAVFVPAFGLLVAPIYLGERQRSVDS